VTESKIKSGKHCRAGIEIHFRNQQSCGQRKARRRGCWFCKICFSVKKQKTSKNKTESQLLNKNPNKQEYKEIGQVRE
jgi:hypothetical protein